VSDVFEGIPEDVKALLLRAKDQTRRTGILCEPQVLQLRLWPRVVFKDVLDVDIDPLDIEAKTVNYLLRVKVPPKGKDLAKRAEVLAGWIRSLLGDDWLFNLRVRQKKGGPGRSIYKGERKAPLDEHRAAPTADLPGYEFQNALTSFKRYKLRDLPGAFAEASAPIPPIAPRKP